MAGESEDLEAAGKGKRVLMMTLTCLRQFSPAASDIAIKPSDLHATPWA